MIYQNRFIRVDLHCGFQISTQCFFFGNDLHGAPSQHKAGPHQHRITNLGGRPDPIFNTGNRDTPGLGNFQIKQDFFKGISIFSPVDGLAICSDDGHAPVCQRPRQIDGSLSAKGRDYAFRPFQLYDVHDVFHTEGFKV